ncbi:MAG: iron chelate uptake ABC transporter family permease subunit, partial [Nanobdellota archaeon]
MKSSIKDYKKSIKSKIAFILSLCVLILIAAIISISIGPTDISVIDIIHLFLGADNANVSQIILNIRLPRVMAALASGCALAVSGLVMQNSLRNPLASPFTLGVSHAAAFGAAFSVIILGVGSSNNHLSGLFKISGPSTMSLCAFAFSLLCIFIIILMVKFRDT